MPNNAKNISDQLAEEFVAHTIDLMRLDAGERKRILGYLSQLQQDLVNKLQDIDPTAGRGLTSRQNRLARLLKEVNQIIDSAYQDMASQMKGSLFTLAELEASWVQDTVDGAVGLNVMNTLLTTEQLRAIVSKTLIRGAPSSEWWKRQKATMRNKFADQIRLGFGAGESIDDMVRRIRGKATGKRNVYWDPRTGKKKWYVEFADGIMDTSTRNAQALVRTSVAQIAADTRREMYKANDDIVNGLQQISTLDGRTTDICIAYSGASWDRDGKPINGTVLPYAGGLARHWNERSVEIPLLVTWRELGIDIDEIPLGTRSSMDGQVAAELTFNDFLKGKSPEFQDDLLGKGKAELWRRGKISLTDLVDQTGRSRSLEDLSA